MRSKIIDISKGNIVKRLFVGISQIGYTPQSAILDIIDNSISARSQKIKIILKVDNDKYLTNSHNVDEVVFIDDGKGMNSEEIENALTLGTPRQYEPNSLSKFGFGLKSAGSSLGNIISVISKKKGSEDDYKGWFLDIEDLEEGYKITEIDKDSINEIIDTYKEVGWTPNTFVKITGCQKLIKRSANFIHDNLTEKIGVTYCNSINKGINISIEIDHKEKGQIVKIPSLDILYLGDTYSEFDIDTYKGDKPVFILDQDISIGNSTEKAKLQVSLFPKAKMNSSISLNEEERLRIKEYNIGSKNKGCFIYRNDRLISWGNNLEGIITRDDFGVRARLFLSTDHDDILGVDVSKQRLSFPDIVLTDIKSILKKPIEISKEIFKKCDSILGQSDASIEGEGYSEKNKYLDESDPDTEVESNDPGTKIDTTKSKKRKSKLEDKDTTGDSSDNDKSEGKKNTVNNTFQRIRYSEKIDSDKLFTTSLNREYGTYITINKNHSFYNQILSRLSNDENKKQIIEAVFWALGVAENKTIENLTTISDEEIDVVLTKFHKVFQFNLNNWSSENTDLLNDK